MKMKSEKFGELTYKKKEVIHFAGGLLGFENTQQFIIVDEQRYLPFVWLQSIDNPKVCFVAINPYLFYPEYKVQLHQGDQKTLKIDTHEDLVVLTLVVVPIDNPKNISTNLLAPIIINRKRKKALQIIMNNSGYTTKHLLMPQDKEQKAIEKTQVA